MEYHFYGCLLDQWFTKSRAVNDGMLERNLQRRNIPLRKNKDKVVLLLVKDLIWIVVKLPSYWPVVFKYDEFQIFLERSLCNRLGH